MPDSPEEPPPHLTSIFEAARLGWNVQLTCIKCGSRRLLHAAVLWLALSLKGRPDDLNEARRVLTCSYCLRQGRRSPIRGCSWSATRRRASR